MHRLLCTRMTFDFNMMCRVSVHHFGKTKHNSLETLYISQTTVDYSGLSIYQHRTINLLLTYTLHSNYTG